MPISIIIDRIKKTVKPKSKQLNLNGQNGKDLHTNENFNCMLEEQNEGKSWPQILAIFAVTLGSFTNGIMYSWSSPFALVISKDKENYNITEDEASYFIIFQPVGMIIGTLFFFKIVEVLGRKKSLLCLAVPHLISWIIILFARTKWEFYASRFFGGIGEAFLFSTIPPYVGEIATPVIRGYFGNIPVAGTNAGILFITVLGNYCDVITSTYICIGLPVLFGILISMLPESPYQLIRDGKYEEARKSIKWFIRKPNVEGDFLKMKADVERQLSEKGRWKDLVKIDSNRRALRASVFLRFSQQLCGITVFAAYTQPIFQKAGGNIEPKYSSMIFVGLIWILNLLFGPAVERFGRKLFHFYSLLSCGSILLILSAYFCLEQYEIVNLDRLNWFPLAGMVVYVFTYAFGLGIVPTLMLGELFSASVKSKGLSVNVALYGVAVFISMNLFYILTSNVGLYAPFLLYGICCLVSTILTLRWVPETKGKTLEEIQQAFKK